MADDNKVEQVGVRIVRPARPYNVGETAWFVPRVARRLVVAGAAVYLDPPDGFDEQGKPVAVDNEEGLRHNGGGWYELLDYLDADGNPVRVKGKVSAIAERDRLLAEAASAAKDNPEKVQTTDNSPEGDPDSADDGDNE